MSRGPYLHIAALWLKDDRCDELSAIIRGGELEPPAGYPRGYVVTFRNEVARGAGFARLLSLLDLAELNDVAPSGVIR